MPQVAFRDDLEYYEGRAEGLLASATDGTAGAVAAFERWEQPLTVAGPRAVLAREHGRASWAELAGALGAVSPFVRAYRAIETRDVDGLASELDCTPGLVSERGTNDNDLLGIAAATCDERLVRVLLDRGADPVRANVHGWTPLHQAAYSDLPGMAEMLLDAGAPVDVSARGDGGTPLIVALFWGNRHVAELIAERGGVVPANLRAGAGLGRLDVVEEAGAQRGFYRPHSGFPTWRPSDDPQEVLNEALAWASRNNCAETLEILVEWGANVDADVYRGTALTWAAACGRRDATRRLLALGADPNRRGTFGGPEHGEGITALHLAAQQGHVDVIRILLDGGADPAVRDRLYDSTPAGWADHAGREAAARILAG